MRISKKYGWHLDIVPFIWLNWSSHFCLFIFGSNVSRSLIGIDTATRSWAQPIHSLFWVCFTKSTKGTGSWQNKGGDG